MEFDVLEYQERSDVNYRPFDIKQQKVTNNNTANVKLLIQGNKL